MSLHPIKARALALTLTTALGAALAQTTPPPTATTTAKPAAAVSSAATSRVASAVAVEVGGLVKGQIVQCPSGLKLGPQAVCLYVKSSNATVKPLVRGKLAARALGDWKTGKTSSSLLVAEKAGGPVAAYILLSSLTPTESLLVVDAAAAAPAARASTPAGVVKGQPYVLGTDLVGVVNVSSLGNGKYRLNVNGQTPLTVTVGQKVAQRDGGNVELALAPATDGKNLILPLVALRSVGCTVTPAGANLTVACGAESVGLKPIVF